MIAVYIGIAAAFLMLFACNLWLIWRWQRLKKWVVRSTRMYERQRNHHDEKWSQGVVFGRVRMCDDVLTRMYQLEQEGVRLVFPRKQAIAARKILGRYSLLRRIGL